ncbi:MAG: hypothetical protein AMXMBFR53_20190 [Gemmatimonadota bacterium]
MAPGADPVSLLRDRRGITTGDGLLALSVLALLLAATYPRIERAAMRKRADAIVQEANTVLEAARRYRVDRGEWPRGAEMGVVPEDLVTFLPPGFSFEHRGDHLKWDRWERVRAPAPDSAPAVIPELPEDAPPPEVAVDSVAVVRPTVISLGGLTVGSDDPRVLAVLLENFGHERSFVRGATWTLVVPPAPEGP